MQILIVSVISILGWFILMWVSTNILGLFVRGFFKDPVLQALDDAENEKVLPDRFIKSLRDEHVGANGLVSLVALILFVGFLFFSYYFLGAFALLSVLMQMIGRFPDLIWEIRHGKKIDVNTMPKDIVYYLTASLSLLSFPVFGYAIYLMIAV